MLLSTWRPQTRLEQTCICRCSGGLIVLLAPAAFPPFANCLPLTSTPAAPLLLPDSADSCASLYWAKSRKMEALLAAALCGWGSWTC